METDTYGFGQTGYYICELDNGLMATGNRQGLYVTNHKDECSKVDEQITGVTSIQKLKDGNSSIVAVGCRQGVWFYDADLHQKLGSVLVNKGSVIELENAIVAMATDGKHHLWAINNYGTLLHYDSRTSASAGILSRVNGSSSFIPAHTVRFVICVPALELRFDV